METEELVKWINSLIQDRNIKPFYNSALWEHIRAEVLEEQHHECQLCKAKGLYVPAFTVHHVKYLRDRPDLALTKSNLLLVCKDCHYKIHHTIELKPQLNEEKW